MKAGIVTVPVSKVVFQSLAFGAIVTSVLVSQSVGATDFYVGAGGGLSVLEPNNNNTQFALTDDTDTGSHLLLGKDFSSSISGELSFTDLGSAQFGVDGEIEYSVIGLSGLYYPWTSGSGSSRQGLSIYGRAGLGKMDNKSQLLFRRVNDYHLLLGAGLEYVLENGFGARAELISFDEDAQYASVSLLYRFGGQNNNELAEIPRSSPEQALNPSPQLQDVAVPEEAVPSWSTDSVPVIYFDNNSVDLDEAALVALDSLSQRMTDEPDLILSLVGHTDSRGSKAYNAELSRKRAVSVAKFLVDTRVSIDRIKAYAKGEESQVDADSEDVFASNRRVAIYAARR